MTGVARGTPCDHPIFFVGRRVRVRLSGECTFNQPTRNVATGERLPLPGGHPPWQNGLVGRIAKTPPHLHLGEGHTLCVLYDGRHAAPEGEYVGGAFAPHELIPLDQDGNEVLHPALARFER